MDKEKITQAVARGFRSTENEGEVVAAALVAAITDEVCLTLLAVPGVSRGEYKHQLGLLYDKAVAADTVEGVALALHILKLRYDGPFAITGTVPHGSPTEFRGSSGCAGDDLSGGQVCCLT